MSVRLVSRRSSWARLIPAHLRQFTRSSVDQKRPYDLLVPAVQTFRRLNGHCAIPLRFTVPSGEDTDTSLWSSELQGMKLGTTISRFLKACTTIKQQSRRRALDDVKSQLLVVLGRPNVDNWKRFLWEEVTVPGLQTYRTLYGDLLVPVSFTVPHGDGLWPKSTWGYKLGYWTSELRRQKDKLLQYQLDDLEVLDFSWNAREVRWNRFFLPAVQRYQELYGRAQVPQSFVVPSDDPQWPEELRGFRLGQKVNNLRCGDPLGIGPKAEEVELIYKNWMLLETLLEVEGYSDEDDQDVTEK